MLRDPSKKMPDLQRYPLDLVSHQHVEKTPSSYSWNVFNSYNLHHVPVAEIRNSLLKNIKIKKSIFTILHGYICYIKHARSTLNWVVQTWRYDWMQM